MSDELTDETRETYLRARNWTSVVFAPGMMPVWFAQGNSTQHYLHQAYEIQIQNDIFVLVHVFIEMCKNAEAIETLHKHQGSIELLKKFSERCVKDDE